MRVEVAVENPNLEIVPGMYAAVNLKVQRHPQSLAIPIETVGGRQNPTVYVVNSNSEIEDRPIKLGLETPDKRRADRAWRDAAQASSRDLSRSNGLRDVSPRRKCACSVTIGVMPLVTMT